MTSGLLGEQYVGLEPGGDSVKLKNRRRIQITQDRGGAGESDRPVSIRQGSRRSKLMKGRQNDTQRTDPHTPGSRHAADRSARRGRDRQSATGRGNESGRRSPHQGARTGGRSPRAGWWRKCRANVGWRLSANAFVGLAPKVDGGFYQDGATIMHGFPVYAALRRHQYQWRFRLDACRIRADQAALSRLARSNTMAKPRRATSTSSRANVKKTQARIRCSTPNAPITAI